MLTTKPLYTMDSQRVDKLLKTSDQTQKFTNAAAMYPQDAFKLILPQSLPAIIYHPLNNISEAFPKH